MSAINLTTTVTTTPDLDSHFYVEAGALFYDRDYAEAYDLNVHDLNADDVKAAQDKAAQLNAGEWMLVEHDAL